MYRYKVEVDPDYEGFWSVFCYNNMGSGYEVAGKIGQVQDAEFIADAFSQHEAASR